MANRHSQVRQIGFLILALLTLALTGSRAIAQSASIDGLITDSTNAVVPNAAVDLLEPATQTHQKKIGRAHV